MLRPAHHRRLIDRLLWSAFLALFLVYYISNATLGFSFSLFDPESSYHAGIGLPDYYGSLADALLQGQLHLLQQPSPELVALSDPYDPSLNAPFRTDLHDMSLYKDRLYLYFGITPALLLWLPTRLMGLQITDAFAVVLFSWGALLAS